MDSDDISDMLATRFKRLYGEGFYRWTRANIAADLDPRFVTLEIDDVEVQNALTALERAGLIRLVGRKDLYLEVLHD